MSGGIQTVPGELQEVLEQLEAYEKSNNTALKAVEKLLKEEKEKREAAEKTFIKTTSPVTQIRAGHISGTTEGGGNIAVTYSSAFPTSTDYILGTSLNLSGNPVFRFATITASGFVAFFNSASTPEEFNYVAFGH